VGISSLAALAQCTRRLIDAAARTYISGLILCNMSTDPYHAVQHEIQSSLQTAATLRASFLRIRNMARDGSEELVWARNEVSRQNAAYSALK
jgi:hypothetical protein